MSYVSRSVRRQLAPALRVLPHGGTLPEENWRRRHLALTLVLVWHVPLLFAFGLFRDLELSHLLVDALVPLALGSTAFLPRASRGVRSVGVAAGLITCSVMLVHLSHGLIEAHFHFFVIVALLTLYQDWKPFLVAIGLTVLEHGITGVLDPHAVYNHPDAWAHPWRWALIHGAFVVAASAASITAWAMSESDHRRLASATAELHAQRVELLSHEAHHDGLTGLPNRRMLLDHLQAAGRRATARGSMVGVLFVDLDHFKHVNDTYGHLIGDVLLRATADRLRGAVRGSDLAARLGGDEFVIVCEGLDEPAGLETALSRVAEALREPVRVDDDLLLTVHASIGHVVSEGGADAQELLDRADLDMYRVKHLHRVRPRGSVPRPRTSFAAAERLG